jgi:predicted DNA-binding protein with PD1-like motif
MVYPKNNRRIIMQASEGKMGRVFILRLEDGDVVPDCIEAFASEKEIKMAGVTLIGGIGEGQIVVGPRYTNAIPPDPMLVPLEGAHEVVGLGLIVPNSKRVPKLHIHAALGRSGQTKTGCLRLGVKTWLVGEAIIYEILGANAARLPDKNTGFELLQAKPNISKRAVENYADRS